MKNSKNQGNTFYAFVFLKISSILTGELFINDIPNLGSSSFQGIKITLNVDAAPSDK